MNGAATNPDFDVVAYAGAQVKNALDATIKLGGENYVFWGGREGYMSLLNTNMKKELEHMAKFLHMAKDYARSQGFKGTFFIEPKPMEPTKHQYDFDAATELLGAYKEQTQALKDAAERGKEIKRDEDLKAAGTETAGTGVSTEASFTRSQLMEMRLKNPSEFELRQPEIIQAYAEGRVLNK